MALTWKVSVIVCLFISHYSLAAPEKQTISQRMGRIDSSSNLNDVKDNPFRFVVKRENDSIEATTTASSTEASTIKTTTRWSLWPPLTTQSSIWNLGNISSLKDNSSNASTTAATYRHNKNSLRPSKGLSYYLWDTVYIVFKCFRDNWRSGVMDCVTSRAASLMDGFFGFGEDWSREDRDSSDLMPYYREDLEESPRQDDDGFGRDEEDYGEGFDGEDVNLSEGGRREDRGHHHKKEKLKLKVKRFHKILHTVISTALMALPIVIALKLKFFMLLSMGIAALSLVSGKAFILSMVSFVLAIVAILKRSSSRGHSISRVDDIHSYLPSRKSTFIDDYMPEPPNHYYYMRR